MNRVFIFVVAVVAEIAGWSLPATAREICAAVNAEGTKDEAAFRKLVDAELRRHPKFHVVKEGCDGTLVIDFLVVEKKQYLTVRMDNEIPYRVSLTSQDDTAEKLGEGISTVLANDPETLLKNIEAYGKTQSALSPLVVGAENIWALELFESFMRTGKGMSDFVPGFAFLAMRSAGNFSAFIRIHLSGFPKSPTSNKAILQVDAGISLGMNYEFLERRNTSPYIGFGLMLKYFRIAARADDVGEDNLDEIMPAVSGRVGVRLFRFYAMHCDIFLGGELPMLPTGDKESYLFTRQRYTPFVNIGTAVGF